MARITGINQDPSGQVGNVVYRQTKKGTVVAKSPRKSSTPRRSEKQMYTRCQLGNVAANFHLYEGKLVQGFEDKTAGQNEFNLYIQVNYGGQNAVFITKQERLNGACVVAPYQFTRGTLKSVGYALNADNVLATNLRLGNLEIGAGTTVGELSEAIIGNNAGWQEGDQLTFFYAVQDTDPMTLVPRGEMFSWKVILDSEDDTVLLEVVNAIGFTSVASGSQKVLGMDRELVSAGAAWVHSRDMGDGTIKLGTQRLYVVNEMLAAYQTTAAWKASADSYGGVNTKEAYLNPGNGGGNSVSGSGFTVNGSGSTGNGTTGGSETPSGGGGSQTPTVAAPTFSGATQFTETTQVTMSGPAGASIFYTLDGSTPTDQSLEYEEPITLSATTTVKAIAIKDGVSSSVTTRVYTKGSGSGGNGGDGEE